MIDYGQHSECFVGTTTALILGGLAAAGSLGGAAIQAHAAGSAADKEQQAGQQALGLQRDVYNNTRADLSPYNQLGTGALGNLRGMLGLPAQQTVSGPPAVPTNPRQSVATLAPNAYTYNPQTGVTLYNGYDRQTGQISGTPPVSINGRTGAFDVTPNASGSGFVKMQAPDGSFNQVDPRMVPFYQSKGAKVVSNG